MIFWPPKNWSTQMGGEEHRRRRNRARAAFGGEERRRRNRARAASGEKNPRGGRIERELRQGKRKPEESSASCVGGEETRGLVERESNLRISNSRVGSFSKLPSSAAGFFPLTCKRIECPAFDVIDKGNGYEIRRYNSTPWISTSLINNISFVGATRDGFMQLFSYIQGNNKYGIKIEMTAPVITEILPSDGPFCTSTFAVSFYVPKENQADPPPANGLHLQLWGVKFAAVRQFAGFVEDSDIGVEAAALYSSLASSSWAAAVDKGGKSHPTSPYTVAQYNSPFEYTNRVNEIWMLFDEEDIGSS